jgi:hypothetical protein
MTSETPISHPVTTVIRIHYEPPEGATIGVRCGEAGVEVDDWQKFYYAIKKVGDQFKINPPPFAPNHPSIL